MTDDQARKISEAAMEAIRWHDPTETLRGLAYQLQINRTMRAMTELRAKAEAILGGEIEVYC